MKSGVQLSFWCGNSRFCGISVWMQWRAECNAVCNRSFRFLRRRLNAMKSGVQRSWCCSNSIASADLNAMKSGVQQRYECFNALTHFCLNAMKSGVQPFIKLLYVELCEKFECDEERSATASLRCSFCILDSLNAMKSGVQRQKVIVVPPVIAVWMRWRAECFLNVGN